ncbi:MAG: fatty acid desaturase [Rhodobacteraceae bacterium]|nr:fatty acid desaturase [Paracoccaceae bacterium]
MTDHKTFLASLGSADRAALTQRSDRAGLRHLALHLGLIAATTALIGLRAPFWPLFLPLHGILITFLFTLEHECTHKTPFATGWLNEAAGTLAGLVLILPFQWFRAFHLAHHRFTNIPGHDPELAAPGPATVRGWLFHVSGLPYWRASIATLIRMAARGAPAPYLPDRAMPRLVREARLHLAVYALALLSLVWSPLVVWLWIVPSLIGQPFLRLYLLAEHGDCAFVANMFENTRTTFTTGMVRFLAWNMPYHVEHHVAPSVPFHHLPRLHRLMRDRLRVTAPGYAAFTRAYLDRRRPGGDGPRGGNVSGTMPGLAPDDAAG